MIVAERLPANASMGPHVFACGNKGNRPDLLSHRKLQWGRTFLRAEIIGVRDVAAVADVASMGPHVFACGNAVPPDADGQEIVLQWGRTFLRAEIVTTSSSATAAMLRFNGAARFCVRKYGSGLHPLVLRRRFNGAARFCVRKSGGELIGAERVVQASMGPHVFACGNRSSVSGVVT